MIKTIIVIDNDRYLYNDETKILLKMINNGLSILYVKNKKFDIIKNGNNTATIKISKVEKKFFFFNEYKLLTTLKIKYN
jgi:hypothetical protein